MVKSSYKLTAYSWTRQISLTVHFMMLKEWITIFYEMLRVFDYASLTLFKWFLMEILCQNVWLSSPKLLFLQSLRNKMFYVRWSATFNIYCSIRQMPSVYFSLMILYSIIRRIWWHINDNDKESIVYSIATTIAMA